MKKRGPYKKKSKRRSKRLNEIKYLTVEQIEQYLSLSKRTVYKMIHDRKIPCFRVGGCWRFDRDVIDAWITKRMRPAK